MFFFFPPLVRLHRDDDVGGYHGSRGSEEETRGRKDSGILLLTPSHLPKRAKWNQEWDKLSTLSVIEMFIGQLFHVIFVVENI